MSLHNLIVLFFLAIETLMSLARIDFFNLNLKNPLFLSLFCFPFDSAVAFVFAKWLLNKLYLPTSKLSGTEDVSTKQLPKICTSKSLLFNTGVSLYSFIVTFFPSEDLLWASFTLLWSLKVFTKDQIQCSSKFNKGFGVYSEIYFCLTPPC